MNIDLTTALASLQDMVMGFVWQLPYVAIAVLVFAVFFIAARLTRKAIRTFSTKRRKHRNVGLVLGRLAEGGLILVGLLVALVIAIPSFKPAQLIQILGISGVAIGFAFRDILQNFLAGILILLTEPFRLGDQIVVGSYEGTVEEIETRATLIRTYDGRRVVIPNSNLFTQPLPSTRPLTSGGCNTTSVLGTATTSRAPRASSSMRCGARTACCKNRRRKR